MSSSVAMPKETRGYRAGDSVEDYSRPCKTDRMHTVVVTNAEARPLRISCGYCHSEHNYRGGGRVQTAAEPSTTRVPSDSTVAFSSGTKVFVT